MKYLDEPRLAYWSTFFNSLELGDRLLSMRTDAYSCKKAGHDKRLSKELERHMREKLSASPAAAYGTSPSFGQLTDVGVRRTLVDLICTMNASFPDHDFSGVKPDYFQKEASVSFVRNKINAALAEISVIHNKIFLENFWADVNEVMKLKDCEVYSYAADTEGDPFTEGCLWSFNYFFINKTLKRVLFLHCTTKSKLRVMEDSMGAGYDSDADDDEEEESAEGDADHVSDPEHFPGDIMGDMDVESAGNDDDSMT